ncbi:MAG: methyltransferase domain-containing protein [Chloroflexi bacterium]|nr:methyltransferase domain-containing protein [Chloroflexota bacterium]MXX84147.1 methyltransferase domain-containing protein [Chloroflexota bacterium]MYA94636.1 methyltransferase domain-containing protein [Chloroflexota bacterium]
MYNSPLRDITFTPFVNFESLWLKFHDLFEITPMPKSTREYEAEVVPGIEKIAMSELRAKLGGKLRWARQTRSGFFRFGYGGAAAQLKSLRSVIAIYTVHHFQIPRPRAWLGDQHFRRLCEMLRAAAGGFNQPASNFGIGAAGSDSPVMLRLRDALGAALGLPYAEDGKGQLYLRLLRAESGGWDALARTTPAPLSKRAYRLVDAPGALNASVAYAMTRLAPTPANATVINLCSGTATILIEQELSQATQRSLGIDWDAKMLAAGKANAAAANCGRIIHLQADARATPLPRQRADLLYADLPFGGRIGTHAENEELYPAILREAARLARQEAKFVLLTQEIKLLQRCLRGSRWRVAAELPINLSGLHPRIFVLALRHN